MNSKTKTWQPEAAGHLTVNLTLRNEQPHMLNYEGTYAFVHAPEFRIDSVQATDGQTVCVCSPEEFPWQTLNGRDIVSDRRDVYRGAVYQHLDQTGMLGRFKPASWRSADAAAAYLQQAPLSEPRTLIGHAHGESFVVPCLANPQYLVERIHSVWPSLERNWPADEERLADSLSQACERGMPVDWDAVEAHAEAYRDVSVHVELLLPRRKPDGRMALDFAPHVLAPVTAWNDSFTIPCAHSDITRVLIPSPGHTVAIIHPPRDFACICAKAGLDHQKRFPALHAPGYGQRGGWRDRDHKHQLDALIARQLAACEGRDFITRSVGGRELVYRNIRAGFDGAIHCEFCGIPWTTYQTLMVGDLIAANLRDCVALAWHACLDAGYTPIGVAGMSLVTELPKDSAQQDLSAILARIREGRLDGERPPRFYGRLTDRPGNIW